VSETLSKRGQALLLFGLDKTTARHIDRVEETARRLRRLIEEEDDPHVMRSEVFILLAEHPWLKEL